MFSSPDAGQPDEHSPQVRQASKLAPAGRSSSAASLKLMGASAVSDMIVARRAAGRTGTGQSRYCFKFPRVPIPRYRRYATYCRRIDAANSANDVPMARSDTGAPVRWRSTSSASIATRTRAGSSLPDRVDDADGHRLGPARGQQFLQLAPVALASYERARDAAAAGATMTVPLPLREGASMTTNRSLDPVLRFGILGCANIARQFARDVAPSAAVRVVAVASRNAETAAAFAASQGIARHHGSYEALLADTEVDAVYLPLPNSLHAEWAIKARSSAASTSCAKSRWRWAVAEAQAMFDAARRHGVDAARVVSVLLPAADRRPAGAAGRRRHRRGALGAGLLRLHAGQPAGQHPDAARAGRRRAARRGQLSAEPDPPGHGMRTATVQRRRDVGRHRRRHQHDGDAALRRRPPRAAVLRDGRRQPSPRHDRGQRRARSRPST